MRRVTTIIIEIVPSHWIVWNKVKECLEYYYMSKLMLNKKRKEMQSLVKQGAPPDIEWPKYKVEIRGRTKSYKDAIIGLEKLKTKQYVGKTNLFEREDVYLLFYFRRVDNPRDRYSLTVDRLCLRLDINTGVLGKRQPVVV
ncbi:hypothetical protein PUN28_017947 [Cardiocondyla obscurior]|uniref:Uncharacterized protein n=1 Tax=Cardiocondyla obscurior TaxID=286306 RepID=A0AAW2EHB0_9HYME